MRSGLGHRRSWTWLLLCMISGCNWGANEKLVYQLGRLGGHPAVALGNQLVVFEGVEDPGPDVPSRMSGFVQVKGGGVARGKSSVDNLTISTAYQDGVQTLSIGGSSVKIIDAGNQLQIAGKPFPVYGKALTIRLAADGSVRTAE